MDKENIENFIKEINNKRKTGTWYQYIGNVNGNEIRIKGYKTWLQIYSFNGINYSNPMDRKVKEFNQDLIKPFKYFNDQIEKEIDRFEAYHERKGLEIALYQEEGY